MERCMSRILPPKFFVALGKSNNIGFIFAKNIGIKFEIIPNPYEFQQQPEVPAKKSET